MDVLSDEICRLAPSQTLLRGCINQSDLPSFFSKCCITFAALYNFLKRFHQEDNRHGSEMNLNYEMLYPICIIEVFVGYSLIGQFPLWFELNSSILRQS